MNNFLTKLMPNNDHVFYGLFNKAASNSVAMAKLLNTAIEGEWVPEQKTEFAQIGRLKAQSAELKRQVYAVSGKALISPFERNDMYALVSAMNGFSDYIDASARRINLYSIDSITTPIRQLCKIVLDCALELEACVMALKDLSNGKAIVDSCNRIKQLEHEADMVYDKAFAVLNNEETDTFRLIKYGEILASLERTTDKCEQVSYVVESILVKNS
ncbi:DUF47 family protein [Mucilaginibacter sp. CSA2-8R]|uniref:DUF47 domain-containing protein n=1 Tax=Mucilaginibacter sp. CSA2-8R TaxID=3141542 RepID=UPI00315D4E17